MRLVLLQALIAALPIQGLCLVGLGGLVGWTGGAGTCMAAQSGQGAGNDATQSGSPGGNAGATASQGGIRDPMNPQQYMQELAGRLSPAADKHLLLKGVARQKGSSSSAKSAPSRPMSFWPVKGSSDVPASQAVPQEPARQAVPAERGPGPREQLMAFWNGPAAPDRNAQPVQESPGTAMPYVAPERTSPIARRPVQAAAPSPNRAILGPLGMELASPGPGLTLRTAAAPADLAATVDGQEFPLEHGIPKASQRWSLGADLDKYRAHAVREGSRDSGESVKRAFERAGMALGDGVNVFVLGYASDRAEPFRANDGKGLLDEPGRVPEQIGATAGSVGDGLYSIADLILLNSLPDPTKAVYVDNHPAVRPLVFTGQAVGGVWKTTEEVGNAVTWGLFDNVTGCIGLCIESIMEMLKHTGQAVTNLVRGPVHLVAGQGEGADRAMDWVLLVPLEFVSNSVEMKGISNMQDYETAFEDKGVVGSLIEFGGSSFLVYRAIDELVDELDDNHHHKRRAAADSPVEPPAPPSTPPPLPPDLMFLLEGKWPEFNTSGMVLIDGVWTTIKMWRQ